MFSFMSPYGSILVDSCLFFRSWTADPIQVPGVASLTEQLDPHASHPVQRGLSRPPRFGSVSGIQRPGIHPPLGVAFARGRHRTLPGGLGTEVQLREDDLPEVLRALAREAAGLGGLHC